MMILFYKSFIESILTFCITGFYGNLTVQNKNRLSDIVRAASKLMCTQQLSLKKSTIDTSGGRCSRSSALTARYQGSLLFSLLGGVSGSPGSEATALNSLLFREQLVSLTCTEPREPALTGGHCIGHWNLKLWVLFYCFYRFIYSAVDSLILSFILWLWLLTLVSWLSCMACLVCCAALQTKFPLEGQ